MQEINIKQGFKNYTTTTVCTATLIDKETGLQLLSTTLQDSNIDFKEDSKEIRGGQGNPILFAWNTNRQIKLKLTDAVSRLDWTAAKIGQRVKEGVVDIWKEGKKYTVENKKIVLDVEPKKGVTPQIFSIDTGVAIDPKHITLEGKEITIAEEAKIEDGTKIFVYGYYTTVSNATYIDIDSDKFAKTFEVILTFPLVEKSGNTVKTTLFKQYIFPMGQLSGSFSEDSGADSKGTKYTHEIKILDPDGDESMGRLAVFPVESLSPEATKSLLGIQ